MPPNFVLLEATLPNVARLLIAMVQARDAVESRSWSHPQELTTEEWWADVLADPRAQIRKRRGEAAVERTFYRLADEPRETILVACSKCDWKAASRCISGSNASANANQRTKSQREVRTARVAVGRAVACSNSAFGCFRIVYSAPDITYVRLSRTFRWARDQHANTRNTIYPLYEK
jgi:hypothetical protein